MLPLQLVIGAIAQGCVYGLVAMGIVLIYQTRQTISLAQGEFMLMGAWIALLGAALGGLPYGLAALVALLVVAAMGWLMQNLVLRPLAGRPAWALALLTGAIAYGARKLLVAATGTNLPSTSVPSPYPESAWTLAGVPMRIEFLAAIAITALVCGALWALFRYNKVGIALHAAMRNRAAAHHMGLPVRHLDSAIWVLAALLAGTAGLLLATWTPVDTDMASTGLKALPAAVMGGLLRLRGAMMGGIFIGLIEAVTNDLLPDAWHNAPAYVAALLLWSVVHWGRKVSP